MGMRKAFEARAAARIAAAILILTTFAMLARTACAQAPAGRYGGYMRVVSASGHVIAGESTDPMFNHWIPLRQTTMPTAVQMAAMAKESSAVAKSVHPPIVVTKDRDSSSLVLLGAYSSHQHFPEIEITATDNSDQPAKKYKLTDATIISIRASGVGDGTQEPVEQLRINYAKIEIIQ
jgi:type VI secretion system Hcp family effector